MTFMYSAFIVQFKFAIVLKEVTDDMKGNGGYTRNFHLRQTVQKDSLVHKNLNVLKCSFGLIELNARINLLYVFLKGSLFYYEITPNGPRREKTGLRGVVNNTGADQPAHPCSLISDFVICFLESTICKLATGEISIF